MLPLRVVGAALRGGGGGRRLAARAGRNTGLQPVSMDRLLDPATYAGENAKVVANITRVLGFLPDDDPYRADSLGDLSEWRALHEQFERKEALMHRVKEPFTLIEHLSPDPLHPMVRKVQLEVRLADLQLPNDVEENLLDIVGPRWKPAKGIFTVTGNRYATRDQNLSYVKSAFYRLVAESYKMAALGDTALEPHLIPRRFRPDLIRAVADEELDEDDDDEDAWDLYGDDSDMETTK